MNRRGFLGAILAAGCAPAIVKAANLMPIFVRAESGLLLPASGGNQLLTIDMITREALRILHKNMTFVNELNTAFAEQFSGPQLPTTIHVRKPRGYSWPTN